MDELDELGEGNHRANLLFAEGSRVKLQETRADVLSQTEKKGIKEP